MISLNSLEACKDSVSGGKGSSLAQMLQMHLTDVEIPLGIVVTTMAFTKHLDENFKLKSSLDELQALSNQVSCKTASIPELEGKCQRLVNLFIECNISTFWNNSGFSMISLAIKMAINIMTIKINFILYVL